MSFYSSIKYTVVSIKTQTELATEYMETISMHHYQELNVWKKSVELAAEVYAATKGFPAEEKYGITSQIRRSVVSTASNIAEGAGRGTDKDFANFISHAAGSAYELETQLLIALKVEYLDIEIHKSLRNELEQIKKNAFCFTFQAKVLILDTYYFILNSCKL